MLALHLALYAALAAPPAPDTVAFRFAWPDGFAAQVEYNRVRRRTDRPTAGVTLKGRLVSETTGPELRVGFREWRSTDTGPAVAGIDPMLQAASRVTTVASRTGKFQRVDGIEPALEVIRDMGKGAPADARPMLAQMEKMAPALLAQDASDTWAALVGFWAGKALDVGEDYESDSRAAIPALPGESVRLVSKIRVERRLPCPGAGGACVEVALRSAADAKDLERLMKRLVTELGLPAEKLPNVLGEVSTTTEVLLLTDPARLVPYRLEKTRVMRVAPAPGAPAGSKPVDGRDTTIWRFTPVAARAPAPGR